jgi:hypothetical protein
MLPQDTPPAPEVIVRAEQLVTTYKEAACAAR